jgi:pyridoxine 5-phosphate synthase
VSRLGVNIDHIATLRRLRDTPYPDLLRAATECIQGGADQITVHLREDRRHIVDEDVARLKAECTVDLNLEMAATPEIFQIALKTRPHSICIVPEKREERTTEGGLDLFNSKRNDFLKTISQEASRAGILVSFFIEPTPEDVSISKKLGAKAVELHTGALCLAHQSGNKRLFQTEWEKLEKAIAAGAVEGLLVHAGHGIDYEIARRLAANLHGIAEYNIGHAIVCEALFCGLKEATRKMSNILQRREGA